MSWSAKKVRRTAVAWAVALACGVGLWIVSLRSGDFDWYISETHAHIVYSALVRYREFPYFSFFLNQGSYLLQDPQSPLLSVITPCVLLFGPEGGLRFAGFVFGVAGFWAYLLWAGRRLPWGAATFAAAAWVSSLGILWRIAVGNDLFLWLLVLPVFLLLTDSLFRAPGPRAAAALGIAAGLCLLGPTFHAIVYLIAPASLLWVMVLLFGSPGRHPAGPLRPVAFLGLATIVLALVALPRLIAWTTFDLRRLIPFDGPTGLRDAVVSLVSPWKTSALENTVIQGFPPVDGALPTYGIWESSVALPPLATLLAGIGVFKWPAARRRRVLYVFAAACVLAGLVLTTSGPLWNAIRSVNPSLRVSCRFLIVSSFGLSILAGLGYARVERRLRSRRGWLLAASLAAILVSTLVWFRGATRDKLLLPTATPIFTHPSAEPLAVPSIVNARIDGHVRAHRAIGDGKIVADAFHATGNPCESINFGNRCTPYALRVASSPLAIPGIELSAVEFSQAPVRVSHTTITVERLGPHGVVALNLLAAPALGWSISPPSASAELQVVGENERLVLANLGDRTLESISLSPRSPVSGWMWALWGAALAASCGYVLARRPSGGGIRK